jgi:anti-sigma regulatory factor (Ser/Thr protein kinase)
MVGCHIPSHRPVQDPANGSVLLRAVAVSFVGDDVSVIGGTVPKVSGCVPLVRQSVALVRQLVALIRPKVALVGWPCPLAGSRLPVIHARLAILIPAMDHAGDTHRRRGHRPPGVTDRAPTSLNARPSARVVTARVGHSAGVPALVLPLDPRSVPAARGLLRSALDGHAASSADDAVLMISELVTNAVLHARTRLHVSVSIADQTLRVEVSDDDPTLPVAPDPETHSTSGRGLLIVDNLADKWGTFTSTHGKTVWFELQIRPDP